MKVGRKEGGVIHKFHEKPMVNDKVIMAGSAQPNRVKFAIISQEIIRRMKNMSRECEWEERVSVLNHFIVKMARSGHTEEMRGEILKAGLRGNYKMVEKEVLGVSKFNRLADEGRRQREIKKILGPTEWFQPRHLQSPEVCTAKEEEVAMSPKSQSSQIRRGQGCKKI